VNNGAIRGAHAIRSKRSPRGEDFLKPNARFPRPSIRSGRFARFSCAVAVVVMLAWVTALADDIVLTVSPGSSPEESLQTWSGGTSPYQLHRSDGPQGVVAPAHLFGRTTSGSPGLGDPAVPATGSAFFYVAVSGTCGDGVMDLNEGCDDGGIAPGDGCSGVCQIESAASLIASPGSEAYGNALVGTPSAARIFTITNQGDTASGSLAVGLVSGDTADFAVVAPVAGDCTAGSPLAGHASCTVRARFAPLSAGAKGATLRVSAVPGGAPQATLSGIGKWPLTIDVGGTGSVTRDGSPVCVGSCPETNGYDNGVTVTLAASTQNGSNSFFQKWNGDCSGSQRGCTVTMNQSRSVTALFSPMTHNLAFVSSASIATNLGSVGAYDAQCNLLATQAGLNNAAGNAWIAWVSLTLMSAPSRIPPTTQGWVRVDGEPFATTMSSLLSGVVFHPLRLNELGVDVGGRPVMTATTNAGSAASDNCFNWTSNSASVFKLGGDAAGGSGGWSSQSTTPCSVQAPVYCLMKTKTAALTVTPEAGKRIYLSGNFTPAIGASPDLRCSLDKPVGVGTVKAFVATGSASASAAVSPAQRYVRLDGTFLGTGADLAAGLKLTSGMWQLGTGAYAADGQFVWTGAATPTTVGTPASTCGNWTSTASTTAMGRAASTDTTWWSAGTAACASTSTRLYCVEQ
jgi:cysteine-rich repeat protein